MFKCGQLVKHKYDDFIYGIINNFNENYINIRYIFVRSHLSHNIISYPRVCFEDMPNEWISIEE